MPERVPGVGINPVSREVVPSDDMAEKYARLIVGALGGVKDRIVAVTTGPGKKWLEDQVVEAAYKEGASLVDCLHVDRWQEYLRAKHTVNPEHLGRELRSYGHRYNQLGREGAARISLVGYPIYASRDTLPEDRIGRVKPPGITKNIAGLKRGLSPWVVAACANPEWAKQVYPDLPSNLALEKLQDAIYAGCLVDKPDPLGEWNKHFDKLDKIANKLNKLGLQELEIKDEDPDGTNIRVGLFQTSTWHTARMEINGNICLVNVPSMEIWTGPDPTKVDGTLVAGDFTIHGTGEKVSGLRLTFKDGKATFVSATSGGVEFQKYQERDEDARRLGEIALVPALNPIGELNTLFSETLLDENTGIHIALGQGFPNTVGSDEDRAKLNSANSHTDITIGKKMTVIGIDANGKKILIMENGQWAI